MQHTRDATCLPEHECRLHATNSLCPPIIHYNGYFYASPFNFALLCCNSTYVTLACDDNQQIKAYKVILAASSSFFCQILKKNKHSHPLVYLRGVAGKDLVSILDFINNGQVNVETKDLEELIQVGRELNIKGLKASQDTDNDKCDRNQTKVKLSETKPVNLKPKIELVEDLQITFSGRPADFQNADANKNDKLTKLDEQIELLIKKAGHKV